jgi:hypothetical protein
MVGFGKFHQRSQSGTSCQQLQEWPWMGPFGKVCKKYAAAQKQKNDENCQRLQGWYHHCQQLQGRGHSARCARNVLLIRSRGMMKTVNGYKDGTTVVNSCKDGAIWQGVQEMCCWSEVEEWWKLSTVTRMVPPLSTVVRTGPFGKVCKKCAADQK